MGRPLAGSRRAGVHRLLLSSHLTAAYTRRFANKWVAPAKYRNNIRVLFTTKILAINGQVRGV